MARIKISKDTPTAVSQSPQPTSRRPIGSKPNQQRIVSRVQGGPNVTIFSRHPSIAVTVRLRGPVTPPVPRPKVSVSDRPDRAGIVHWDGRDPYQCTIPLIFDGFAAGISQEADIRKLERLAVRHKGDAAPPIVRTQGPVPDPLGITDPQWRIADLQPVDQPRMEQDGDGDRIRYAVDVILIELVVDDGLASSMDRTATAVGISNSKTTVKHGETNLHQVADRVYGDRSKAKSIAVANGLQLAVHLKSGTTLRLP